MKTQAKEAAARQSTPLASRILGALVFLMGVGGTITGPMLFLRPDGSLIGFPGDMLNGTPFHDYTIPGIVMFLFLGLYSLFVGYGLVRRPPWRWPEAINPSKDRHWAWASSWALGIIILVWITVETALFGYISFLQPVVAMWGSVIILLSLLPDVRRYYLR